MQTKLTYVFLIIICIAAAVACKKEDNILLPTATKYYTLSCSQKTSQIDTVKFMIVGTYDWAYSYHSEWGSPWEVWTPLNKGISSRYIFRPNAEVEYYENKKLQWTKNYEINYMSAVTLYPLDSTTMVIIKEKDNGRRFSQLKVRLCNDSAVLYNPFAGSDDVTVGYFSRK